MQNSIWGYVVERRPDGYHNIETVFYPIGLTDILEFVVAPENRFSQSGIVIDAPAEHNLVNKAYQLLARDFKLLPLHVQLHKHIPFGAGLGGGSSDAAYMLRMLNDNARLQLSSAQLQAYARELGSDCAFFIDNRPVYATQRGDHFEPINLSLKGWGLVLVNPGLHVGTAEAYGGLTPKPAKFPLRECIESDPENWRNCLGNDFEETVFRKHPQIAQLKQHLYDQGAVYAAMTGSGSSVFGLFRPGENLPNSKIFEPYFVWQETLTH